MCQIRGARKARAWRVQWKPDPQVVYPVGMVRLHPMDITRVSRRSRGGGAPGKIAVLATLFAIACAGGSGEPDRSQRSGMSRGAVIKGAGASFPRPVYTRWSLRHLDDAGTRVSYRSVGSTHGIEAITEGRVDFGATDIPLPADELEAAGLVQFPMIVGSVVPVVHLPGIGPGELVLSPPLLADIFHGQVPRWDNPRIVELNPDLDLPEREIVVVHRDDPSGTAWMFTRFLSDVSDGWRAQVGYGETVSWPTGVGARCNDQVAEFVDQFRFTIGFVEFSFALENELAWTGLLTGTDQVVQPSHETIGEAAAAGLWSTDGGLRFSPPPSLDEGWPVVGASYVLVRREQADLNRAEALLEFFHWAYTDGAPLARELEYVPVPAEQTLEVEAGWAREITYRGQPVWEAPAEAPPEPAEVPAPDEP